MTDHSVFTKKHEDAMAQDKRAILEEMNLPPAVIEFIRKNLTTIKVTIVVLVLVVIAWESYGKYTSVQREKTAAFLYEAMQADPGANQADLLTQLTVKYSGKGSSMWGKVELGHLAFMDAKFSEAADIYQEALAMAGTKNPLFPLLQLSLAQCYENMADEQGATTAFKKLIDIPGFAGEGYLGLARMAERSGDIETALANYQEFVNLAETQPGPTKDWVDNKIVLLTTQK